MRNIVCTVLAWLLFTGLWPVAGEESTNGELYWSYDRSPPIPHSPPGRGLGDWAMAYVRAKDAINRMSNEEKQNLTIGISPSPNGCVGFSGGAPTIDFAGLCLQDGPTGVRGTDFVTSFPSGLHIGASWNDKLAFDVAKHMGAEFRKKGVNVALGPVAGPLGRVARGGRNWEGFSNDPYISGRMNAMMVKGLQKSVIACVKHLVGNEQETNRMPSPDGLTAAVSSNIGDRAMHELYLWPFQDAIRAGVGSVMCSYNRVNNSYGCQNSKVLNGLLKTELGFQGFVVSDWQAQHSGLASAASGLDMVMPDSGFWKGGALAEGINNGSLPQSRLDDMATRILAAWYLLGMDSANYPPPAIGLPTRITLPHTPVDARNPGARKTIFQAAVEGHVLLKNVNNALPLKSPKLLSLFGFDGPAPLINNPSAVQTGRWFLGVTSVDISDVSFAQAVELGNSPQVASLGTLSVGGGSGANTGPYVSSPFSAFDQKAWEDGFMLHWDFHNQNIDVNPASDACIVFINEFATEAFDRPGLADGSADNLIRNVANKCDNTMVVIHNAGIRLVDGWIEHPSITAVILAHLPGQDSGRALVEIMFGHQSPSGRLPYTIAKKSDDYGHLLDPSLSDRPQKSDSYQYPQSNFNETLYIDYRAFIKEGIEPRFEFGFGLTYGHFNYSSLDAGLLHADVSMLPPDSHMVEGGIASLFDEVVYVSFEVLNSADVAAAEVAQLYVGIPNAPARQLRGFDKKFIQPGETVELTFKLTRRDLSIWDVTQQQWLLQRGEYKLYVGRSVLDTPLEMILRI